MKDFEDLKKSITLGLVMCVVSIIMLVYQVNNSIIYAIPSNLFIIGTMIYFISALIKIKSGKDFMKFSSIILIITIIINIFCEVTSISIDSLLFKYGIENAIYELINLVIVIYLLVLLFFLIIIFFRKIIILENFIKKAYICTSILVAFDCILGCIFVFNYISPFGGYIYYIRMLIFAISIIPYFYQYYNRMVNSYEDNKNNKNVVLEIAGFIVIIFVVLLFLWREIIYSPKSNIENKIKLLSDTYDNIDVNYTTEIINNVSFKLAKSLKVKEDILLDNVRFIEKGSVLGDIIIAVDNETPKNNPKGKRWNINGKEYGYLDMEFKSFTYNNVRYEYSYMGDTLIIYGFIKNNKIVFISMDMGCYATISLAELTGILSIE